MKPEPAHILFEENQSFRNTWMWNLLLVSGFMPVLIVLVVGLSDPATRKDLWWMLLLVIGIQAINIGIFSVVQLQTVVTREGVFYRWAPFFRNYTFLPAEQIAEFPYRKWDRMKWGFSVRKGWGRCHNVNGTDGFRFVLKDGRTFYIGTQEQQAFSNALQRMNQRK